MNDQRERTDKKEYIKEGKVVPLRYCNMSMLTPIDEAPTGSPILGGDETQTPTLKQVSKLFTCWSGNYQSIGIDRSYYQLPFKTNPTCVDTYLQGPSSVSDTTKSGWFGHMSRHCQAEQDRVYMRSLDQLKHLYHQPLTGSTKDAIARRLVGLANIHGVDVCRLVVDNLTSLLDKYIPQELCPDLGQD